MIRVFAIIWTAIASVIVAGIGTYILQQLIGAFVPALLLLILAGMLMALPMGLVTQGPKVRVAAGGTLEAVPPVHSRAHRPTSRVMASGRDRPRRKAKPRQPAWPPEEGEPQEM